MAPGLMAFVALLLPLFAIFIALKTRNQYWMVALVVSMLSWPVLLKTIQASSTCMGVLCQLGNGIMGSAVISILGIIAILISLIKTSNKKKFLVVISILSLFILIPAGYNYYYNYRTGTLNPYTQTCINEGFKGAQGDSCIWIEWVKGRTLWLLHSSVLGLLGWTLLGGI